VHTEDDAEATKYKYDIDYDDGDKDKRLDEDVVFSLKEENASKSQDTATDAAEFSVGDRVKAHFRGKKSKKCYCKMRELAHIE
jgi:hypothetical protein